MTFLQFLKEKDEWTAAKTLVRLAKMSGGKLAGPVFRDKSEAKNAVIDLVGMRNIDHIWEIIAPHLGQTPEGLRFSPRVPVAKVPQQTPVQTKLHSSVRVDYGFLISPDGVYYDVQKDSGGHEEKLASVGAFTGNDKRKQAIDSGWIRGVFERIGGEVDTISVEFKQHFTSSQKSLLKQMLQIARETGHLVKFNSGKFGSDIERLLESQLFLKNL